MAESITEKDESFSLALLLENISHEQEETVRAFDSANKPVPGTKQYVENMERHKLHFNRLNELLEPLKRLSIAGATNQSK